MTPDNERSDRATPGQSDGEGDAPREAAAEREAGRVPAPEPEEAPELLGERSDYPIAWEGEDEG